MDLLLDEKPYVGFLFLQFEKLITAKTSFEERGDQEKDHRVYPKTQVCQQMKLYQQIWPNCLPFIKFCKFNRSCYWSILLTVCACKTRNPSKCLSIPWPIAALRTVTLCFFVASESKAYNSSISLTSDFGPKITPFPLFPIRNTQVNQIKNWCLFKQFGQ